jgi:hypothetical protein
MAIVGGGSFPFLRMGTNLALSLAATSGPMRKPRDSRPTMVRVDRSELFGTLRVNISVTPLGWGDQPQFMEHGCDLTWVQP